MSITFEIIAHSLMSYFHSAVFVHTTYGAESLEYDTTAVWYC